MTLVKKKVKKAITSYRVRLRTRNFTAEALREKLYTTFFPKLAIVRLGSLTPVEEITGIRNIIEINKPEAIETSRDKLLMMEAFQQNKVKIPEWCKATEEEIIKTLKFPLVCKSRTGQGGVGNTLINNQEEFNKWKTGKILSNYIITKYKAFSREYRLHVTEDGCFLAWRKMRKSDAKERWYFNNDNCVWIGEDNPLFDKPVNWDECIQQSVLALKSSRLDIGAVDLRIQSAKDENGNKRNTCDLVLMEINSAPSLGEKGSEFYYKEIVKLINKKL